MKKRMKDGRALIAVSSRTADVLDGIEDLSAWSDEELLRGSRRSKNGNFVGRPPEVVPQAVHAERSRRLMSKAHELLRDSTVEAVELLRSIINDENAPLAVRVQASGMIIDRTLPKSATLSVSLAPPPKYLGVLEAAIISTDTDPDEDIIEAELIEDDEEIIFDD